MSIEALQAYFGEKQGNYIKYLCDLHKEPDSWQIEAQDRRGV